MCPEYHFYIQALYMEHHCTRWSRPSSLFISSATNRLCTKQTRRRHEETRCFRQWSITARSQHSPLWATRPQTVAATLRHEFPLKLTVKRKCTLPTKQTLNLKAGNPLFFKPGKINSEKRSHESVWGSGGIVPHIHNFGTRWRCVVSFTLRSLSGSQTPWHTFLKHW